MSERTLKAADLWYSVESDGSVSVWYPDGDQCGTLYGNIGLDKGYTAEQIAKMLGLRSHP
jgi:hypothetical protein